MPYKMPKIFSQFSVILSSILFIVKYLHISIDRISLFKKNPFVFFSKNYLHGRLLFS